MRDGECASIYSCLHNFAEGFVHYFTDKVTKCRDEFEMDEPGCPVISDLLQPGVLQIHQFKPVVQETLQKIIMGGKSPAD